MLKNVQISVEPVNDQDEEKVDQNLSISFDNKDNQDAVNYGFPQ